MIKAASGRGIPCRLCGAATDPRFEGVVLGRIPNTWWHCPNCDCLQTDPPHWLEEAYQPENRAVDTGIVQRNIQLSLILPVLLPYIGVTAAHRWLDQGGGNGLLCRLMRARGFDTWRHDPFCDNHFAIGFDKADAPPGPWPVVTLFEVLEHLPNPTEDLAELAALDADVIIASTEPYARQGSNWSYLHAEIGQHVFFWSVKGLDILAERLGMRLVTLAQTHVLIRPEPKYLSYGPVSIVEIVRSLVDKNAVMQLGLNAFASHLANGFKHAVADSAKCMDDLEVHRGAINDAPRLVAARPPIRVPDRRPRVLVDGVFFQHMVTGIGRYWESVLRAWGQTEFGEGVTLLSRCGTAPRIPGIRHRIIGSHFFGDWDREAAQLQEICDEEQADVFFSSYYTAPTRTPSVMVVYDMIPERLGYDMEQPAWRDKGRAVEATVHHVSISQATRSDLCALHELDPEPIPIAYPGVDHSLFFLPDQEEVEQVARRLYLPDRYLLMVGSLGGHKNGEVLFEALRGDDDLARIPVVVACKQGCLDDDGREKARGLTVLAHRFSDEDLRVVYARAEALVVPSLLEGFGMTLVEGAACGCPVLCSDIPLFREVLGEAALFFDPLRPDSLRAALKVVLDGSGADRRRALGIERAARYTWSDCAEVLEGVARGVVA